MWAVNADKSHGIVRHKTALLRQVSASDYKCMQARTATVLWTCRMLTSVWFWPMSSDFLIEVVPVCDTVWPMFRESAVWVPPGLTSHLYLLWSELVIDMAMCGAGAAAFGWWVLFSW